MQSEPTSTLSRNSLSAHARSGVLPVIGWVLLIVGGLNWGLVGLFGFDLVAALFGNFTVPSRIVYALVGLAAIYAIFLLPRLTRPSV